MLLTNNIKLIINLKRFYNINMKVKKNSYLKLCNKLKAFDINLSRIILKS